MHIEQCSDFVGVVDTQILVEDTSDESSPESLCGLVLKYNLHLPRAPETLSQRGFTTKSYEKYSESRLADILRFFVVFDDAIMKDYWGYTTFMNLFTYDRSRK